MNTGELINILTYYHFQEFSSGKELIQALQDDDYARNLIAPAGGLKRSTFFDRIHDRGVEQPLYVFTEMGYPLNASYLYMLCFGTKSKYANKAVITSCSMTCGSMA